MKTVVYYVLVALALAVAAAAVLWVSRVERRVAFAQQQLATLALDESDAIYTELASTFDAAGVTAWLFGDSTADLSARRAALRYWQGDYAGLVAEYGDVTASENVPLQFVVANAAYRASLAAGGGEADRAQVLQALDAAIDVYRGVLQASPDHRDAAYNYEYLIRLRADVASGAALPDASRSPNGREGESPADAELEEIKIYVPVQRDVDPEVDESPTLGAGDRIRKRG